MKEEEYFVKTKTFGPVLETREFTDDEKVVLGHFFTNIDRNIYAATDAMPNSLWALLEGGYSRSQVSMRMRFLNIFEEMKEECDKGLLPEGDVVSVKDFASQIRDNKGLNMSFFLRKAEQFMRKWAVQYGHDSLKDSDVVRFAVENITQLAVPAIQEARLGAYQEKSSRYVPFSKESLVVPIELKDFEKEIREWNDFLLDSYNESKSFVSDFFRKTLNQSAFASEAAFDRTVNAKTLDVIRYFLPVTIMTSLGIVWPTREAERHISRLMSDSRQEIQEIGRALLEEGKKVSPGLLSHVAVNDYQQVREKNIRSMPGISLNKPSQEKGRSSDAVKLISISPDIEAGMAAAVLFEHCSSGNSYDEYLQACLKDKALVESVLKEYLENRGKFDSVPVPIETGNLLFEVTVDMGAFRDLKRHRRNLFLWAPFTALKGFEYPEHVSSAPELVEVKKKIELCAEKTAKLHEKVLAKNPRLAEYIVMMANKQRMLWQMDPRQFVYVMELRTTPAGHYSYRTICQKMFRLASPHLPVLSKYTRINLTSGDEGRKQQEEKTVEKLKALGADVRRVS
ncbi:FAD-dependent thymidylate synthase [Candidatus Woesearchaeota archaeon]|nr:FAD-dependent thymidylate synthase [Candidatus Woesearchaeota archaeon]MBW3016615.1 FAD-dependent thymidylate synthase [Candidatus Woesearchaeota archaeon]